MLLDVLPRRTNFDEHEVETDVPGVGRSRLRLSGRRVAPNPGRPPLILLSIEHVNGGDNGGGDGDGDGAGDMPGADRLARAYPEEGVAAALHDSEEGLLEPGHVPGG